MAVSQESRIELTKTFESDTEKQIGKERQRLDTFCPAAGYNHTYAVGNDMASLPTAGVIAMQKCFSS